MELKNLTIADLKAAYDFTLIDLADLQKKAIEKNINPDKIDSYKEVKEIEFKLYNELLNRIRSIK
ncbi:MAG: hypothetical protein HY738_02245 [Bacteroidia bacterium]|nr:hypothetical protein [Bacteroidia bacterium]